MIALAWPFVALVGLVGAFVLIWRAHDSADAKADWTAQTDVLRAELRDAVKRIAVVEEIQAAMKFDVRALENRD